MVSHGIGTEGIIFLVVFYIVGIIIIHFLEKSDWW